MLRDVSGAEAQRRRAEELERDGLYGEAVEAYREAARLDPADASAHVRLGVALRGTGQDEEANRAFHAALTLQTRTAG
jgi:Flp pilus assembly protein TadD